MKITRWFPSPILAIALSVSLAARFFRLSDRPIEDQFLLIAVPALGFGILILWALPFFEELFSKSAHRSIPLIQALAGAVLFVLLSPVSIPIRIADFVSACGSSLAILLFFGLGYEYISKKRSQFDILLGWLIASVPAFLTSGYFSHLYPDWAFPFLSVFALTWMGLGGYFLARLCRQILMTRRFAAALNLLTVILALAFALALIGLCLSYPNLFDRSVFLPSASFIPLFWSLTILSPAFIAWTLHTLERYGWLERVKASRFYVFVSENFPGFILGLIFFAAYASLSYVFNHPKLDTTENYFAADNFAWMGRLAAPDGAGIQMRAVHPFAFFVLRPIAWLFSLPFNNDRFSAVLLLIPFMGGVCVSLIWLIVQKWTSSRTYASLIAVLLGASTAHLWFGSVVESYIFSAAALLLFVLLLLNEKTSLFALVAVGALIFGITITNFIQTFIGFVVARPKLKKIFEYGLFASALSIALTALHAAVFPSALLFFDPADAGVESQYSISVFGQPAWRLIGRVTMLARNMFMYSIAAPTPFALTTEVGGHFPRFNFYKLTPGHFSYSGYDPLGKVVLASWLLLLALAVLFFIWRLIRTRKADLSLAFPFILLFNFALHMGYGSEPFLYAADWTYALILFAAISLKEFGKRRWFQVALLSFLVLLTIDQLNFMAFIFRTISPFFK